MTKYRLVVSGKLYHLIKLLSDRTECLATSKKEPIADHYELEEVQPETMQTMGHKTACQNQSGMTQEINSWVQHGKK